MRHPPVSRHRAAGFSLFDALLSLAIVAGVVLVAFAAFAIVNANRRADDTVAQVGAVRSAMRSLFGNAVPASANPTTAMLARTKLVPGTQSASAIVTPYGLPLAIGGTGAGGFTIGLGAVPRDACLKVLSSLSGDPDFTGFEVTSGDSTVGYGGSVPALTAAQVGWFCSLGQAGLTLTIGDPGSSTVTLGNLSDPLDGAVPVGQVDLASVNTTQMDVPGSTSRSIACDPTAYSPAYCAAHPTLNVSWSPAGVVPTITATPISAPAGSSAVQLTTSGLASTLAVTAPADPNYNYSAYLSGDPSYTGDPPPTVSASYSGTTVISAEPGQTISGLTFDPAAALTPPAGNGYNTLYMTVSATDQNGNIVYIGQAEYVDGTVVPMNQGWNWINAAGTGRMQAPPAGLTQLNISYSIETFAQNTYNTPGGVGVGFSGNPSMIVTTQ